MAKVSVLIACRNYGRYLRACIESVRGQDCGGEPEIIVVDDGSTDDTAQVAQGEPGVRYVWQPHAGVAAARNRALREAGGEYLAFLDADDLWKKDKLALQLRYLREHPGCEIVFTGYENFLEDGADPDGEWVRRSRLFAEKNRTCLPTALFARSLLLRCGVFDERFRSGEDTEWTTRLGFLGVRCGWLEEKLLLRRLHGANLTRTAGGEPPDRALTAEVLRRNLRLRATGQFAGEGISVLVPAYRAEAYLAECLESVRKQRETLGGLPMEILVADDGSDDRTAEIALAHGAQVLTLSHRGSAAARNAALIHARYEYLYFLDADDRSAPDALRTLLQALRAEADRMAVFAQARDFRTETDAGGQPFERFADRSYAGCLPGCSLIRKAAFRQVGFFNETLKTGETVEWLARFRTGGLKQAGLACVTLERRIHPASTGAVNREQERRDYARILREHLKRKNREER